MSGERLTRTELSWLLTQEARSAAEKLRRGVGLTIPPPESTPVPPPAGAPGEPVVTSLEDTGVETMLNRLDETMSMLASLHGQSPSRGRRGKIDVAGLVWELAPEARVQIEMGKGLVVFGDEAELRRMLHVLMAQGGELGAPSAGQVSIRREGEEIKIAAELGPDKSKSFEPEIQWLSRMAIRFGGRLALEGDQQTLILPANDEHREVETLRRELAAAQAQGEAYARELAAVMGKSDGPPSHRSSLSQAPGGEAIGVLVATSRAVLGDIRGILAAIGRDVAPLRDRTRWGDRGDEVNEIGASVGRHVTAASEVISDLAKLANCPILDLPGPVSIAAIARAAVNAEKARAARHDVTVEVDAPSEPADGAGADAHTDVWNGGVVQVLLNELVSSAINASNPGTTVRVTVEEHATGVGVVVDDTGPPLSHKAKVSIPSRDFEALSQERNSPLPLIVSATIAAFIHAPLSIEDGPNGGTRVRVTFPRPT
ncbi:MAG: sensor histidine kinase [Polyangiaceae bacterium]